jgi:hypothetical protein
MLKPSGNLASWQVSFGDFAIMGRRLILSLRLNRFPATYFFRAVAENQPG